MNNKACSANKVNISPAEKVKITRDTLQVDLSDGRTISVPLAWFPRLQQATTEERNNWRLIGKGQGIHWADIDEDISIEGLLAGRPSGESQTSFKKWLEGRSARLGGGDQTLISGPAMERSGFFPSDDLIIVGNA